MYITHCNYSQPASIELDNKNIGGHLTPLHCLTYLIYVQTVTCSELKTPDSNKELRWTALPKPCQKCFCVKRKRTGTESVTTKLRCDSSRGQLPVVTHAEVEHTGGENCPSDAVLSRTSLLLTDNVSLSPGSSLGTKVSIDPVVCASLKMPIMSAPAAHTSSSSRKRDQNISCSLSSMKQQSSGSDNTSKASRTGSVPPLFQNPVLNFHSPLKETETNVPWSVASNVKVTAAVNANKDLDLHRCPLCDMVFDVRCVNFTCVCRSIYKHARSYCSSIAYGICTYHI